MRKLVLGAASLLAFASSAMAADLSITRYSDGPGYQQEVRTYEYRPAPVIVEHPAPIVSETVVVRRPAVVAAPVVIDDYPVYAPPAVYGYTGPVWHRGWGYRSHFRGP